MTSNEMYTEIILNLYNNPKNKGSIKNPDFKFKDTNPSCGDIIEIQCKIKDKKIIEIKFNGSGCAISQASTELLAEYLKNKQMDKIKNIDKIKLLELLEINISPMRLKCALLPLKVFKYGLYSYLGKTLENENFE